MPGEGGLGKKYAVETALLAMQALGHMGEHAKGGEAATLRLFKQFFDSYQHDKNGQAYILSVMIDAGKPGLALLLDTGRGHPTLRREGLYAATRSTVLDRKAFLMELDPLYCDVIVDRFQRFSGKPAVLERTGTSPLPMKPREENMR